MVAMTARSITPPAVAVRAGASSGWLYGPAIDLLLGAGVVYLVTLPLLIGLDRRGQMTAWSITAATMLSLFISGPHYGATILRVYDRREDRRQYTLFAIWATAALAGLFVVGLHWVLLGSILVTAYATWTPWHFSGQNYGVALMFLRRRGIQIDPRTKHFIYASFVTSFLLSIAVMHSVASTVAADSTWMQGASAYRFLSLGIPQTATRLADGVSLVGAGLLLLRRARAIDLLPVACIALMQSAWFALPAALPILVHVRLGGPAFDALWLSAAHSTQYLWVTSFYASQEQRAHNGPQHRDLALRSWWVRTLLAGSMVTTFPAIVFAPGVLGTFAWDNGLSMLLVSTVGSRACCCATCARGASRRVDPRRESDGGARSSPPWGPCRSRWRCSTTGSATW